MVSALGLGLVILGGAVVQSFRAATLPTTERDIVPPTVAVPDDLAVLPLLNGILLSREGYAFRGGDLREPREFAIGALLVRHPQGTLLIDAGFGASASEHVAMLPAMMRRATRHRLDQPIGAALESAGVTPDVVLLTHAHWDHVSGLEDLPEIPVLLPAAELTFVAEGGEKTELARRYAGDRLQPIAFGDGPWLGFPASHDHFGDGSVVVVPAPGHTPGSIVVFVTLPSGTILALIGDTAWQLEGVELPAERPWLLRLMVDEDPGAVRGLLIRLHELADALLELIVVPAHDGRAWARVRQLAQRGG